MDKIVELKNKFEEALKEKTSWGRNELKTMFDGICIDVMGKTELEEFQGKGRNIRLESNIEVTDVTIKPTVKSGELRFQFDDEDSEMIAPVMDFHPVAITLVQQKPYQGVVVGNNSQANIVFTSKSGKKFKLFIDDKVS